MSQPFQKTAKPWYRSPYPWIMSAAAGCIAFIIGWFLPPPSSSNLSSSTPLRLSGYQFISPLLACGLASQNPRGSSQTQQINNLITGVINKHIQAGDVSKASVFFIDYPHNTGVSVNGDEKYYPSSIGKIPIMMAYYAIAERTSRSIFDKEITYPAGSPDLNLAQDIKPAEAIVPGHTYSVAELIDYMIKYSDNNAAELLYNDVAPSTLSDIYTTLGIPVDYNPNISNLDFMTAAQVSMLFRILYNATYLSTEDSEAALGLLSQTSFTQGLAAGVPSGTAVAHKLGLVGISQGGATAEHELHDCGIVYAPHHPYLLCVMTRGASPLVNMEGTISDISQTVYNAVAAEQ